MRQKSDLHTHSIFSDGTNTPEEMVQAAIAAGLEEFGISDHGYTVFDESYCMRRENYADYLAALRGLREKYAHKIRLRIGIEQDFYGEPLPEGLDYVIGSVHYLRCGNDYIAVDEDPRLLLKAADEHFRGDIYSLCECYYETVAAVVSQTGADIIGHFDLIAKFNQQIHLFDESHRRYRRAWQRALEELLPYGKLFEINHGAQHRGLRSLPYLKPEMQDFLRERGGLMLHGSDSHAASTVGSFPDRA